MTNTLRLIYPDWQSGNKAEYYFGADLLKSLIPKNKNQKEIKINVESPQNNEIYKENGVYGQSQIINNVAEAKNILDKEKPSKIITLGGNCMISQAPFDYLKSKYKDDLGVIWIDTHPDISSPENVPSEHAMVVANLLGQGDNELSKLVSNPLNKDQLLYVGLQDLLDFEVHHLKEFNIDYEIQNQSIYNYPKIQNWINKNNFSKIAIHFDIDVLNPKEFKSTYFAEPNVTEFPSASGQMSLKQLNDILSGLFNNNDVVGFTVAEYLPWDQISLKNIFSKLNIFE